MAWRKASRRRRTAPPSRSFSPLWRFSPSTTGAAEEYGQIRVDLERKGTPIGPLDTLIAAHARSRGLTLVTNNTREFFRVENLPVEDWTK